VPRDGIIDPTDVEEDAPRAAPLPEHRALSDQLLDHLAAFEGITPPWRLSSAGSNPSNPKYGAWVAAARSLAGGRRVYLAWVKWHHR